MIIFRHVTFVYIRPLGGHYYRWKNISKGLCYCSYSSKRKRNQLKEKNLRLFNSTNKEIDVSFRAQNFTIFFFKYVKFCTPKIWYVWSIWKIVEGLSYIQHQVCKDCIWDDFFFFVFLKPFRLKMKQQKP